MDTKKLRKRGRRTLPIHNNVPVADRKVNAVRLRTSCHVQSDWWQKPYVLSQEELIKCCWKCRSENFTLSEEAEKEYARLIKGCVQIKLHDILKRWIKDKNIMAYLSIFGNRFNISGTR